MQNIIIANQKFQENIVNLVNNSGLPAFIMKQTLKDVVDLLEQLEEQQLQEAVQNEEKKEKKEAEKDG